MGTETSVIASEYSVEGVSLLDANGVYKKMPSKLPSTSADSEGVLTYTIHKERRGDVEGGSKPGWWDLTFNTGSKRNCTLSHRCEWGLVRYSPSSYDKKVFCIDSGLIIYPSWESWAASTSGEGRCGCG